MSKAYDAHTLVLAGHGYDETGPYLVINDIDAGIVQRFSVRGRTFSLRRLPRRRCIGRFDLETYESQVCPLNVVLLSDAKETMCPACAEATGFNPSFYYSDFVSPQQRAYNLTPHFVYLAYFSPQHIKAGISSETRGIERLLEQGARAACVVRRFENAYDARELEAALCAQPDILETMRATLKTRLLVEERYDAHEAHEILSTTVARLGLARDAQTDDEAFRLSCQEIQAGNPKLQMGNSEFQTCNLELQAGNPKPQMGNLIENMTEVQDLSPYYFGGPSPECHTLQIPEGYDDECGGRCIGMVGANLVFDQGGANYVVSIKEWESFEVELLEDEVICEYDFEPQQFSLF